MPGVQLEAPLSSSRMSLVPQRHFPSYPSASNVSSSSSASLSWPSYEDSSDTVTTGENRALTAVEWFVDGVSINQPPPRPAAAPAAPAGGEEGETVAVEEVVTATVGARVVVGTTKADLSGNSSGSKGNSSGSKSRFSDNNATVTPHLLSLLPPPLLVIPYGTTSSLYVNISAALPPHQFELLSANVS